MKGRIGRAPPHARAERLTREILKRLVLLERMPSVTPANASRIADAVHKRVEAMERAIHGRREAVTFTFHSTRKETDDA